MVPKGLAAAVLASLPAQMTTPPPGANTIQAITFASVFLSILITAVAIPLLKLGPVAGFYNAFSLNSREQNQRWIRPKNDTRDSSGPNSATTDGELQASVVTLDQAVNEKGRRGSKRGAVRYFRLSKRVTIVDEPSRSRNSFGLK